MPAGAGASSLYHIDQRFGTIGFSVSTLGLFRTEGRFKQFAGDLLLDAGHPERTRIDVSIDGNSVDMPLREESDLLRSATYFDTARYPREHFVSTSVQTLSPSHYLVHGTLEIRGVVQPQDLDAVLSDHHVDTARNVEVADFVVTGKIRRSAFGMVANRVMVSDTVRLDIRIRLTVDLAPQSG